MTDYNSLKQDTQDTELNTPEPIKMRTRVGDVATGALVVVTAAAVGATVGMVGLKIHEADKEKTRRQDAILEKIMKPTAIDIAQYAIDHSTEEPFVYKNTYQYSLGDTGDGHTTLDVVVTKVDGKAPSATDVTRVQIVDWAAPGGGDYSDTGPSHSESLSLEDSTWTAGVEYDPVAPYDDTTDFDHSYGSYQQPEVTFEANEATAHDIVQKMQKDFKAIEQTGFSG